MTPTGPQPGSSYGEAGFLALADSLPQLVWAAGEGGACLYLNRRWLEYTGQTPAEASGYGWTNALHPEDRDATLAAWEAAWRNDTPYEGEYRLRRHDGRYHWFMVRANQTLDPARNTPLWVGTCTDVHAQKLALERGRRLQSLVASLLGADGVEEVARAIVRESAHALGARSCVLYVRDAGTSNLQLLGQVGFPSEGAQPYPVVPLDAPYPVAVAARTGEPVLRELEAAGARPPSVVAAVPLIGGRVNGALGVELEDGEAFASEERALLLNLSRHCSLALDRVRLQAEAHDQEKRRELAEARHQETARALVNASDQLSATLESITDAFAILDGEWRFSYLNAAAERLYGRPREDFIGRVVWEAIPRSFESAIGRLARAVAADGEPRGDEVFLASLERWVEARAFPVGPGVALYLRDRTTQRQAEEALRESEARFRALFESSPDGIAITDRGDSHAGPLILECNEAYARMNGYSRAELIGQPLAILYGDPGLEQEQQRLLAHLRSAGSLLGRTVHKRKDGSLLPVESSVTLLRLAGRELLVGIDRDISERDRAAERLREYGRELEHFKRALDEHSPVSITDPDGTITYVNDKFVELTGYSREELIGRNHRVVRSDAHDSAFWRDFWDTIRRGEVMRAEITSRRKDGSPLIAQSTVVPFLDDAGTPYKFVAIRSDVTALRESERRVADLNAQLLRRLDALRSLGEIDALVASGHLDSLLETLLGSLREHLRVDAAAVMRLLPGSDDLVVAAASGLREPQPFGGRIKLGEGVAGRVAASGEAIEVNDLSNASTPVAYREYLLSQGFTGYLAVPIASRGLRQGALSVWWRRDPGRSQEWRQYLTLMAAHAALALERDRAAAKREP